MEGEGEGGRGGMRGADVGACLQDGHTPVYVAAQMGQVDALRVLTGMPEGLETVGVAEKVNVCDTCRVCECVFVFVCVCVCVHGERGEGCAEGCFVCVFVVFGCV